MAQDLKSVKIINGALHESPLRGGTIILRGVIDSNSLKALRYDDYQREALPLASLAKLTNALKAGESLPDIEIGMRGAKTRDTGEHWYLQDECYVIDGQQRVNACINALSMQPGLPVFLGAAVHFNTDKIWERTRFRILNSDRVKVSPNVLARNLRDDHPMLAALYKLSHNDSFVLGGKVSWDQNMRRTKLLTALNLLKVAGRLHTHISPGQSTRLDELAKQLDALAERATASRIRENVATFFGAIDEMWGIRTVQYRDFSPWLHGGFLYMLARFFSNHLDFWRDVNGWKLFIDSEQKRKIASFPLNDPGIKPLTSSAGASANVLYELLLKHVNSGRRTKRLQPRPGLNGAEEPTETVEFENAEA